MLPFEVSGGTPEDQAWAAGLSASLSAMLTQLTASTLQIAPLGQAQPGAVDAGSVRTDLGATLVLTGAIEPVGANRRIAARLVDTLTSQRLRTRTFDVPSSEPGAVQERLLEVALEMLEVDATDSERAALVASDTRVSAASDLYLQGRGHLQRYEKIENVESAIAAFSDAVKLDERYARAWAGLGEAHWRKYESTKQAEWSETALANCTHALILDPRLAPAHVCLGRVHSGRGRHEEGAVEFRRAIEIEPTNDDAYAGLGEAEQGLGQLEQAEDTYRRAIALRSHHWDSYNRLGRFYFSQGRYGDAAQMFAQVVALAPDSFRGYSNLGGTYVHLGRYDEAITALERALALRPTAVSASNLGTAYFNRGRFADAARAFERAVKLVDMNYELWGNLADAYYWAPGERAGAAAAYRRAIALGVSPLRVNPRNTTLIINLAHYHAMLDERMDALELVRRALEIAPQDAFVQFRAAVAFNRVGDTEEALALLEKARAAGFSVTVIRDTPDLNNLWGLARFQNLLRGQ